MIRILAFLAVLFASSQAFGQANEIPNCYTGTNAFGAAVYQPCPGNIVTTVATIVIATGATFQTVLAAGNYRSLTIENNNTNGDNCYVYLGASGATAAKSILLIKGGSYSRYFPFVPSDTVQATCDTTNDTLYVDHQ